MDTRQYLTRSELEKASKRYQLNDNELQRLEKAAIGKLYPVAELAAILSEKYRQNGNNERKAAVIL